MSTTSAAPPTTDQTSPPASLPTFEAFLAWAKQGDVRAEWIAGEILPMSPNSLEHQELVGFLYRLMVTHVEEHRLGRILFVPVLMRLPTRPSGREPDLLFVAAAHAERLKEAYVDGPADLVVEIVSPESDARDRGDKFVEYEAAGISEYWLIDPLRQEATFYQLGRDGRYHREPLDTKGRYASVVLPGFRLSVAWLWQRPLPPLAEALRQFDG